MYLSTESISDSGKLEWFKNLALWDVIKRIWKFTSQFVHLYMMPKLDELTEEKAVNYMHIQQPNNRMWINEVVRAMNN